MVSKRDQCGTYAGALTHRRYGEPECDPCRIARNAYQLQFNGCHTHARARLRLAHPTEYKAILDTLIQTPGKSRSDRHNRAIKALHDLYIEEYLEYYADKRRELGM